MNFSISLDSHKIVTNYIGVLHSYIRDSLLLFEPTTIDVTSVKATHLESIGKNDKVEKIKRYSFTPHNDKFKGKGKGKDKKVATTKKEEREKPSCTHCKKRKS